MNLRRLSFSFLALFCPLLILTSISHALTLSSSQINKVSISFLASDDKNSLKGKVWKKDVLMHAQKIKLELFDQQKALILRTEIPMPEEQRVDQYLDIDFDLDLTDKNLNGTYVLKAEIFNKENRSIASGEGVKEISSEETAEKVMSLISNLAIKVDKDLVKGGVKFQNNEEDGEFKAKIDVYRDDNKRSYVGTFLSDNFAVKKGENKELFFSFMKPTDPQLYHAEVLVIQKEKEITGKLIKPFIVKGDFGEFANVEIELEKYVEKGGTIKVEFSGVAITQKEEVLSVEIDLTDNDGFSAKKFVNVRPEGPFGEFKAEELFLATKGVGSVFAKIILWNGNDELAQITKETNVFEKPRDVNFVFKMTDMEKIETLSNADKYKIVVILVLILLAIVLFIRGLIRSNKSKKFFTFLAMILLSSTAFAAYPTAHFYPEGDMAYSQETGFDKIGFWGYVSIESLGGLLPVTKEIIDYEVILTSVNDSNDTYNFTGEFENENSYEYKFEMDMPDQKDLPDGTYKFQLKFSGQEITERLISLGISPAESQMIFLENFYGDSGYSEVIIDRNAPVPEFSFGRTISDGTLQDVINNGPKIDYRAGDYVKDPFVIKPSCGDDLSGCHTDFAGFKVTGNFCDSSDGREFCGDIHKFQICDKAGNCSVPTSADIDFYDPVDPKMDGGDFISSKGGFESIFDTPNWTKSLPNSDTAGGENSLENIRIVSGHSYILGLRGAEDPTEKEELVDDHVCVNAEEFKKTTIDSEGVCVEKEIACAVSGWGRGTSTDGGVTCTLTSCPNNFIDNGAGECEPSCFHDRFPYCFDLVVE